MVNVARAKITSSRYPHVEVKNFWTNLWKYF
jgi:hypothetical protein